MELVNAVNNGNIDTVIQLINKEHDINYRDPQGYTPLISAILNNDVELVKILLKAGANVNLKYQNGFTALMYALVYCKEAIKELLKSDKLDINIKNDYGFTALSNASLQGQLEFCKLFVKKGAIIHNQDIYNAYNGVKHYLKEEQDKQKNLYYISKNLKQIKGDPDLGYRLKEFLGFSKSRKNKKSRKSRKNRKKSIKKIKHN